MTSLVGHRGSPLEFPENSIPGLARCLDLDARFIEIDVQLTLDHQVVLHHDRTMARSCGVRGAIHQYTLAELNRFSFSEPDYFKDRFQGLPPATLETAVTMCRSRPGLTLFIEVKPVAVEVVRRPGGAGRRSMTPSADPDQDEVLISYRTGPSWRRPPRPAGPGPAWILQRLGSRRAAKQANRYEYLFCNVSRLPAEGLLDPGGPKLGVYDVIDPGLGARLLQRGVDLVETFDLPGMLGRIIMIDVLVVGGGIHGTGVAQAAAAAGYRTLLVERHTLGPRNLQPIQQADPRRVAVPGIGSLRPGAGIVA